MDNNSKLGNHKRVQDAIDKRKAEGKARKEFKPALYKVAGQVRWHQLTEDFLRVYEDMGGREGLLQWAIDSEQPGNRACFYQWLIKMIPTQTHHKVDIEQYNRVDISAQSIKKIVAELSMEIQEEDNTPLVSSQDDSGSINESR